MHHLGVRAAGGAIAGLVLAVTMVVVPAAVDAGESAIALLAPVASMDKLGPEARAAWELARELAADACLVLPAEDGKFVDARGKEVPLAGTGSQN